MERSKFINSITLGLGKGLACLPNWLRNIAVIILFAFFLIIPNRYRKNIRGNLKIFFPYMGLGERLALTHLNILIALFISADIVTMWFRGKEWAKGRINKMHNLELATKALKSGKGVIFVSPHLGNWELLGPYLGEKNAIAIYKELRNPHYMRASGEYRKACGLDTISVHKPMSLKKVMQKLKRGGRLIILPDQNPQTNHGAVIAKFYGVNILSTSLLAKIVRATQSEVIYMYALRRLSGKYDIFFQKADEGIYSKDLRHSVTAGNKSIEKCIGKNISQYNWLISKIITEQVVNKRQLEE